MLVFPDERVPLARLIAFMEHGEHLARDCSRAQASLVSEKGTARFLLGQSRQESAHALAFHTAVEWLAPRHLGECPFVPALKQYRTLILDAMDHGRVAETFLAEQIILEGLGTATLRRMEAGLVKRKAGFLPLRRMVLQQEDAHHEFGHRMVARAVSRGETSTAILRLRAQEYLSLVSTMMDTLGDLFASIDEDACAYVLDVQRYLPSWVMPSNSTKGDTSAVVTT